MIIAIAILRLAAGVGIFLVGIVMFSECLERNASSGMRSLFKKISNNRAAGVGVGAGVTAIIQSSSATTVMVIGLVNAGILTLFQATAIIMGANIGTTVTGLLVSLSGIKIIKYIFMSMAFVGAIIKIATKKENVIKIADLLISFGILFIGLDLMSGALSEQPVITNFFQKLFETVSFPLLLILLGAAFTAVIQSSSASTAIFIIMIGDNLLTFGSALFLVLGANIGTCITALLASLTANTNSKRTALIHVLFNTIGTIIFAAIIWPFKDEIVSFYTRIIPNPQFQLAVFHIIFNVSTTLILIWFIKPLNKLTCFIIKDKPDTKNEMRTSYIDERLLTTPTIAIEQTKKEIIDMAKKSYNNLALAFEALVSQDLSGKDKILHDEAKIDFLNQSLARYLVKISATGISQSNGRLLGSFHHVINDIERIGDHAVNILNDAILMKERNSKFSDKAIQEIQAMYQKVSELFTISLEVFSTRRAAKLKLVSKIEEEIDEMKTSLANAHITRLNAGQCTFEGGEYFYALITELERIGDHLTNIAFSINSFTGSQSEVFKDKVSI